MNLKDLYRPITICGLAGVGKSTAIERLVRELKYTLHSSGGFVRQYACEVFPNLDKLKALASLEENARKDRSIDLMIDQRAIDLSKSGDGKWILDSRLGWHFCPHAFKVLFNCDDKTRLERIARRDGSDFSDALYITQHREKAIRERYLDLYGINDFTSPHLFDFVAHTAVASTGAVADQILVAYKAMAFTP